MIQKFLDWLKKLFSKRPTVVLTVCAQTGLLPNPYCPTKIARFYKDEAPILGVCDVHKKTVDPIQKADTSKPQIGLDWYAAASCLVDQIKKFISKLVLSGGCRFRMFLVWAWGVGEKAGWKHSIYRQVGWIKTDTEGGYADQKFPVFAVLPNLETGVVDCWNEEVWAKYREIFKYCAERDVVLTLSIFDGCSFQDGGRYNPLVMNREHVGADVSEGGSLYYEDMNGNKVKGFAQHTGGIFGGFGGDHGIMKSWIRDDGKEWGIIPTVIHKVVSEASAFGGKVRYGFNEWALKKEEYRTWEQHDQMIADYCKWFCKCLKDEGVQERDINLSLAGEAHDSNWIMAEVKKEYPSMVFVWHGPNSAETLEKMHNLNPSIELDGDGQDSKAIGYNNGYFTMPSFEDAVKMYIQLVSWGSEGFSTFPGHGENKDGPIEDIELTDPDFEIVQYLKGRKTF